eukprot:CAMPEP_0119318564 /NCGR_PEP_ID=MMETSP1333-20130426/46800_1 /TAXON_ID=418940 /ORGANISM="Scyphosphaera apsteinii, Strain RCC1455" /LENGTH=195 /DNA_ID=CAMNT_0007324773 /DNA_START=88 /DNA_END=673 /DNA_ORIENTATION=+
MASERLWMSAKMASEPFAQYTPAERDDIFLRGGDQAETLRHAQIQWRAAQARSASCVDSPDWQNFSGKTCADYANEWCAGDTFRVGMEWTSGGQFNYPEQNCCVCGKPTEGEYAEMDVMANKTFLHTQAKARVAACTSRARREAGPMLVLMPGFQDQAMPFFVYFSRHAALAEAETPALLLTMQQVTSKKSSALG